MKGHIVGDKNMKGKNVLDSLTGSSTMLSVANMPSQSARSRAQVAIRAEDDQYYE